MSQATISRRSFLVSTAAIALSGAGASALFGCGSAQQEQSGATEEIKDIVIACLAREEPDVLYVADKLKDTYNISSQVFSDNNAINEATIDGSVALNYFQNQPYLDSWNENKGSNLQSYGDSIFYTCNVLVSKKFDTVDDITDGARILIANDDANRARELRLLEAGGLITLNDVDFPTVFDVIDNPKNIELVEVDPRSRVGAFPDADAMVAPSITVYQMEDPDVTVDTALLVEDASVYEQQGGVILTVTKENADAEPQWLKDIYAAFTTEEFAEFLKKTYQGAKIPA